MLLVTLNRFSRLGLPHIGSGVSITYEHRSTRPDPISLPHIPTYTATSDSRWSTLHILFRLSAQLAVLAVTLDVVAYLVLLPASLLVDSMATQVSSFTKTRNMESSLHLLHQLC